MGLVMVMVEKEQAYRPKVREYAIEEDY